MATNIQWFPQDEAAEANAGTLVVGHKATLQSANLEGLLPEAAGEWFTTLLNSLKPSDTSDSTQTWLPGDKPQTLAVGVLPTTCSRHNSPSHPHALTSLVREMLPSGSHVRLVVVLDDPQHDLAAACAVARAFPLYSSKSKAKPESTVSVHFATAEGAHTPATSVTFAADGVRLAGRLVDAPTSELNTTAFVAEAKAVAERVSAGYKVIEGQELAEQGFGGLWNVGRAAVHPPALVVLSHEPEGASETIVWVGKGVVYDTGGLSIKGKNFMPGMKRDMGGAAAILASFQAAVQAGFKQRLYALLCLAENAVGPDAFRPDDILTMYSGRTVEVNNTDAEGRLVLADGVAYASKHLSPDVILDMATLTGAQLVSTGKKHAGLMCNDEAWEQKACTAGRLSGDLVHPLPYCPEFFSAEFKSKVADMKNSVKDRANAQSSCAGQFIGDHLVDYTNPWIHVDIAGPSTHGERGTGYGVALLLSLFGEHL